MAYPKDPSAYPEGLFAILDHFLHHGAEATPISLSVPEKRNAYYQVFRFNALRAAIRRQPADSPWAHYIPVLRLISAKAEQSPDGQWRATFDLEPFTKMLRDQGFFAEQSTPQQSFAPQQSHAPAKAQEPLTAPEPDPQEDALHSLYGLDPSYFEKE